MPNLKFAAEQVDVLIEHARTCVKHRAPYGAGTGVASLLLAKDDGIYLMSNGEPPLSGDRFGQKWPNAVVYAESYKAPSLMPTLALNAQQYERIRGAVGGDDFCDPIPLKDLPPRPRKAKYLVIAFTARTLNVHWV